MASRLYEIVGRGRFPGGFRLGTRTFFCKETGYNRVNGVSDERGTGIADIYDKDNCAVIVRNESIFMIGENRKKLNLIRLDIQKRADVELKII